MAAAAVVVFGIGAVVLVDRESTPTNQPQVTASNNTAQPVQPTSSVPAVTPTEPQPIEVASSVVKRPVKATYADFRQERSPIRSDKTGRINEPPRPNQPEVVNAAYLPGEESYVKTIADLSKSVSNSKNDVMRPSEQVAYARDMALVTDSIEKMRREVRKNPKNESAKQILYASYQNKIDLLNSVAQREDIVALK
jgi:hypothetical protein